MRSPVAVAAENQFFDSLSRQPLQCRQELPLVTVWSEVGVDEDAVASSSRDSLQRQRDEVSKTAYG